MPIVQGEHVRLDRAVIDVIRIEMQSRVTPSPESPRIETALSFRVRENEDAIPAQIQPLVERQRAQIRVLKNDEVHPPPPFPEEYLPAGPGTELSRPWRI